jgi:uncharacterized protein YjlB
MPTAKTRLAPPITRTFTNDGRIPNHPLPFVLYGDAVDLTGSPIPNASSEEFFAADGWATWWPNGIGACTHYRETLGVAPGRATVFGVESGEAIGVDPDDDVVLLAATGHQCLTQTDGLVVIGAYPSRGTYNLCRDSKAERSNAPVFIPKIPRPETDPAFGPQGPPIMLWRS